VDIFYQPETRGCRHFKTAGFEKRANLLIARFDKRTHGYHRPRPHQSQRLHHRTVSHHDGQPRFAAEQLRQFHVTRRTFGQSHRRAVADASPPSVTHSSISPVSFLLDEALADSKTAPVWLLAIKCLTVAAAQHRCDPNKALRSVSIAKLIHAWRARLSPFKGVH